MPYRSAPTQSVQVYAAELFRVSAGINTGTKFGRHDTLVLNDTYVLEPNALRGRLSLQTMDDGTFRVAEDTSLGQPGASVHLDCAVTLTSPDQRTQDAVVMVELDRTKGIAAQYVLALSVLLPKVQYALTGINRDGACDAFAQVACVSFVRGTRITLSNGEQREIENLGVGDRILTRSDGMQEIRWIGRSTLQAQGAMAPIVIDAGALNNAHDLIVSPDHRLFVKNRPDTQGARATDVMVKARHLVNDKTVRVLRGEPLEYFQLLFDRHHIIYAEGIAAEAMMADPRSKPSLPTELLHKVSAMIPDHARTQQHTWDMQEVLLYRPDAIDILRRASLR